MRLHWWFSDNAQCTLCLNNYPQGLAFYSQVWRSRISYFKVSCKRVQQSTVLHHWWHLKTVQTETSSKPSVTLYSSGTLHMSDWPAFWYKLSMLMWELMWLRWVVHNTNSTIGLSATTGHTVLPKLDWHGLRTLNNLDWIGPICYRRKRESAKVNMYKMRKFDAKDFAFYTSPFWVNLSHFRIIRKKREFINADL